MERRNIHIAIAFYFIIGTIVYFMGGEFRGVPLLSRLITYLFVVLFWPVLVPMKLYNEYLILTGNI